MTPSTSVIPMLVSGCLVALGVVMVWERVQMQRTGNSGAAHTDKVLLVFLTLAVVDMAVFLGYLLIAAFP